METRIERMERRNGPLLRKVGDVIAAEPERYEQMLFFDIGECGTRACIAGHAALVEYGSRVSTLRGGVVWDDGSFTLVDEAAQDALGLTEEDAECVFGGRWLPAGDPSMPLHERVRDALYALADGATVAEVTA